MGKTRLSLAAAASVRDRYADGVRLVELAPLLEPGQLLPAVADAVAATRDPARSVTDDIVDRLRGQHLLLVLDNVEHLLDAAPDVAAIVEAVPDLSVLATSRAPLRVRGETEYAVEPLEVDDHPDGTPSPAARLLLDRAQRVNPGWGADPADAAAVGATCERLAGLPLALELAAARARLLDPASLLQRLDTALQAGPRDLPPRQRTMRATLDWSQGLLDAPARRLLRLMGVFVGGTTLADLEAIAARVGIADDEVVTSLEELVEHSLVLAEGSGRLRMLEPVAQYARDLLREAGEWEDAARAHAAHYLGVAEANHSSYRDGGQVAALDRIDLEHANLTAAAERSPGGRRRRDAGPDGLGAVALLVAARRPRPRPAVRRERPPARRRLCPTTCMPAPRSPPPRWPSPWTTCPRPPDGGHAPTSTPATTRRSSPTPWRARAWSPLVDGDLARPATASRRPCVHAEVGGPEVAVDLGAGARLAGHRGPARAATPTRRCG